MFKNFERLAEAVAQVLEPGAGLPRLQFDRGRPAFA